MGARAARVDLRLVRGGISLGLEFGAHSLVGLVRVAEYLERSVYEPGSLRIVGDGIRFRLLNPPLRLGAFDRVRLLVGGAPVAPERAWVRARGEGDFRALSTVDADRPLQLLPGEPVEFRCAVDPRPVAGEELRVRLELTCVAVPPLVWMEIRERATEDRAR